MRRTSKFWIAVATLFGIAAAFFLIFFIYMGLFENISVYKVREAHSYATIGLLGGESCR